jgi:hypothetical protein
MTTETKNTNEFVYGNIGNCGFSNSLFGLCYHVDQKTVVCNGIEYAKYYFDHQKTKCLGMIVNRVMPEARNFEGELSLANEVPYDGEKIKVTAIADYAFSGTMYKRVLFGSNLKYVGDHAFAYTRELNSFYSCFSRVTRIGKFAFESSNISQCCIYGVVDIGDYAFYNCECLNKVYENTSVLFDWEHVFFNVKHIGKSAFCNTRFDDLTFKYNGEKPEIHSKAFSGELVTRVKIQDDNEGTITVKVYKKKKRLLGAKDVLYMLEECC